MMGGCRLLLFVRHGETDYNRRQVRCGGDVDVSLTPHGEAQARMAGAGLRLGALLPDIILAGPLRRTRRTAELIAAVLGGDPVIEVVEGLRERHLGTWNGLPITETQPWLDAGMDPPGGESEECFIERIRQTVSEILARDAGVPLLVASKGVARALALLTGLPAGAPAGNAEILHFVVPSEGLKIGA